MTLAQLHSLDEDETAILWFIINKTVPPTMSYDVDPELFVSIKHNKLMDRLNQCESYIKEEHKGKLTSLKEKLTADNLTADNLTTENLTVV
jgi:hypothetical protein